jgi:alpha-L-fucosidase
MTMQPWFPEAKLGIFLHWGIYSVDGIPESWSFFSGNVSYEDYMKQTEGFTASKYDPREWADLFKRAGARYVVLTTRHHDGVSLWDTEHGDLSVPKMTPAGRDLIAPYCEALREFGLKIGFYYSHLDWSHPDYAPVPVGERTSETMSDEVYEQWPEGPESPQWQSFLTYHRGQLEELCTNYGKVDLLWFDGDWTPSENEWWRMGELRDQLMTWQPDAILNSRMRGHGDYATPEQGIPIVPPEGPWEFCVTVNDSWGYQVQDDNHKSVRQIVRMFAECIGMGGNMLLDIGPYEDGSLQPEQVKRLEGLGEWIAKHEEAVYPTIAGLPHGHHYGPTTLTKDKETLYAFVFDRPWDKVAIKGIRNNIKRVSVVGTGDELAFEKVGGAAWMNIPGVLWIDVPEGALDPNATVLKIEMEGTLDLYHGAGHAIESN